MIRELFRSIIQPRHYLFERIEMLEGEVEQARKGLARLRQHDEMLDRAGFIMEPGDDGDRLAPMRRALTEIIVLRIHGKPEPIEPKIRKQLTAAERFERLKANMAEYHARNYGIFYNIRQALTVSDRPLSSSEIIDWIVAETGIQNPKSSLVRDVSDYARCGYLTIHPGRPPRYSLPASGMTIEGVVGLAITETSPVTATIEIAQPGGLTNCDSCRNDYKQHVKRRCRFLEQNPTADLNGWAAYNTDEWGNPLPGATGCPGYTPKPPLPAPRESCYVLGCTLAVCKRPEACAVSVGGAS